MQILRKRLSKYPLGGIRKSVRSKIMNSSLKTKKKRSWYKPRKTFKKIVKSKTLRKGVVVAGTVGTVIAVLPKKTLEKAAEATQNVAENVFDFGEDLGSSLGSLVKAVGVTADGLSNGIGFLSENFNVIVFVALGGWLTTKLL